MVKDIETVREITRIFLTAAAILTTLFPILYLFSPWYRSNLGRAVMIQSVSIALAMDVSTAFAFWATPTNLLVILIINVVILGLIGVASAYLTIMLFRYNFQSRKENNKDDDSELADASDGTGSE